MTLLQIPRTTPVTPIPDHRPPARRWGSGSGPSTAEMPTLPVAEAGAAMVCRQHTLPQDLRQEVVRLTAAIVDSLCGRRPCSQLVRWVTDEVLAELVVRARRHQRLREQLSIRSVHLQQLDDRLEVSLRLVCGPRSLALALRLDHRDQTPPGGAGPLGRTPRWVCTAVDFGPPGSAGR